ncbi:xanthine dehydrogenase accessory factor [Yoonia maricola]|uniref:Xanthine dehydrogenase accessory factor n=1 Tax=Yoonia maricola TaxID=420999 RepID=A0A2M8W383_9RHOB|nr:XdhC family protein [Yoonia maricola]PJI85368.1 xanthine dehydrogenase accessory factor [Yoonia maricola]
MKTPLPERLIYAEHASDIIAQGAMLARESQPFALVTSLAIEGGAAREVGSLALVDAQGGMTGYLSNGCIDRDIQHHAMDALRLGQKKLIRYGDGSRFADLKLPCGGALTVLIDPEPDTSAIIDASAKFAARQPVSLAFDGQDEMGTTLSQTFTYTPQHRLVLAGRGAIFRSVAQIGHATGYDLHLMSPETEDLAAIGHLSRAPATHLTSPESDISLDMLDAYAAFLTLFHDHDWEPGLLRAALQTPAGFIGSLGSRRTHAMRQEALRTMGLSEGDLARLHGPIGLVPSLRDASSIAVSTLAEIVAAFQDSARQ